jgi:hypothetical protein
MKHIIKQTPEVCELKKMLEDITVLQSWKYTAVMDMSYFKDISYLKTPIAC